ncbi:hypothetical protein [Alienimonas chondri]|uniref:Uncharacterized protein n=1 Tax=Alienimonas chondri TaxID=2681879 RepID=A0ABX1VGV4_9PLAN|nr:hypothetical protein [Alienimonas chondri]NNJ26513.1 hypothetical protein [Alienimonas chondri]
MSRSNCKLLTVAGLVAALAAADTAFAGKVAGDRLRPGSGFHNRHAATSPSALTFPRVQSNWAAPQPARPFFSQTGTPAYTPQVVHRPTYATQPRVVYSQPARTITPQPRVVYSYPARSISTAAPVVAAPPAAPAPRVSSAPVVVPR